MNEDVRGTEPHLHPQMADTNSKKLVSAVPFKLTMDRCTYGCISLYSHPLSPSPSNEQ
jgi:hypothetical protein